MSKKNTLSSLEIMLDPENMNEQFYQREESIIKQAEQIESQKQNKITGKIKMGSRPKEKKYGKYPRDKSSFCIT